MATDVTVLAPHKLPFHNKELLAEKLADLHKVNIEVGFSSPIDLSDRLQVMEWKDQQNFYDIPSFLLHRVEKGQHLPCYNLLIDKYFYTWYYQQYGEEAGSMQEFIKFWGSSSGEQNTQTIKSFIEDGIFYEFEADDYEMDIFLETIRPVNVHDPVGYTRWGLFVSELLEFPNARSKQEILEYIHINRKAITEHGGNCAYYVECPSDLLRGIGEMEELDMTWNEVVEAIKNRVGEHRVFNLRKVLSSESYRQEILSRYSEEWWGLGRNVQVFYDDFGELPSP